MSKRRDKWTALAEHQPPTGKLVLLLRLDGKVLIGRRQWWEDEDEDEDDEDSSSWGWVAQENDDSTDMNWLNNPLTHWRPLAARPSRAARLAAVKRLARRVRREVDEALDGTAEGKDELPTARTLLHEYESLCKTLRALSKETKP